MTKWILLLLFLQPFVFITAHQPAHFNGLNGQCPRGTLTQASNGKVYGMTTQGNNTLYNNGVFYEFDINNNTIIVKSNFNRLIHDRLIHGYGGYGEFTAGGNGKLYGLSAYGINGIGAQVLEYDIIKDTFTAKSDIKATIQGNLLQVNGVFGVDVKDVKSSIAELKIYPNPANNMLNITLSEIEAG